MNHIIGRDARHRLGERGLIAGCEFGDHAHRVGVVDIQSHLSKRMRKPHRVVERYEGTRLIRITFGEQLDDDAIRHFRTMHGGGCSRYLRQRIVHGVRSRRPGTSAAEASDRTGQSDIRIDDPKQMLVHHSPVVGTQRGFAYLKEDGTQFGRRLLRQSVESGQRRGPREPISAASTNTRLLLRGWSGAFA